MYDLDRNQCISDDEVNFVWHAVPDRYEIRYGISFDMVEREASLTKEQIVRRRQLDI